MGDLGPSWAVYIEYNILPTGTERAAASEREGTAAPERQLPKANEKLTTESKQMGQTNRTNSCVLCSKPSVAHRPRLKGFPWGPLGMPSASRPFYSWLFHPRGPRGKKYYYFLQKFIRIYENSEKMLGPRGSQG